MYRDIYCGLVSEKDLEKEINVSGWVQTKRDMGGIIFLDLKDREGVLQVVFDASNLTSENFASVDNLKNQSVISVYGKVRLRDEETINPKIKTGYVEVYASKISVLSTSSTLPFQLNESNTREDLRLKYRYLDLRRDEMFNNIKFRHKLQRKIEDFLDNADFISVDTPLFTKSTPEGARDYLVPSRVHEGKFFALPQSPQIFKQLLMVGGIDKYYQVAKCLRDEDLRADRQPEFTQVDLEMSFVEQEDVLIFVEKLFKDLMKEFKSTEFESLENEPFQRMTWTEAMDIYGSDKPDLRFDLPIIDISKIAKECQFSVFRQVVDKGGVVRAINVKGGNSFTRTQIEHLTELACSYGAKGMAWIGLRENGEVHSILKKFFSEDDLNNIIQSVDAKPNDFILFCADKLSVVRNILGRLRLDIGDILNLRQDDHYKFLIVTDFPQFEYSEEEGRYLATHHPFTMPYDEDIKYLLSEKDKGLVRAKAYDFVLNGVELGSGSVRIHDADVQETMFKSLGFTQEEINNRFGFMVEAFKYGTPPHAGFAFGLDRLVMLLVGAKSLREVIAFPKNRDSSCPLTNAPDFVDEKQLEDLNLGKFTEYIDSPKKKEKSLDIDVEKVADLAKLYLPDNEKEEMKKTLTSIIEFADQISNIDTSNVKVCNHILDINNVFRKDEVTNINNRKNLIKNSVTKTNEFIYVPKVID